MDFIGTAQTIQAVANIVPAIWQALEDKDIGTWIGEPTAQYVRNKTVPSLQLFMRWSAYKEPPHWKPQSDGKVIRVQATIPNVRRSAMDYDIIRSAMGGGSGYLWGRFWCSAELDCGGKIRCFGGTKDAAERRVRTFLELTESKLLGMFSGEELNEGSRTRDQNAFKDSTQVYPFSISILNTRKVFLNERKGKTQLDGKFERKYARAIPMWWPKKPMNFDETMREMLRKAGN